MPERKRSLVFIYVACKAAERVKTEKSYKKEMRDGVKELLIKLKFLREYSSFTREIVLFERGCLIFGKVYPA